MSEPKMRPLLIREGAEFQCFNDGLCCTDIHALGPITKTEAKEMRKISAEGVWMNPDVDDLCLKPADHGGCHFLKDGLCSVHAQFGPDAKPEGCRRFPYGLVSTPDGGRVTTEHRCPCRTLGERPPIDIKDAEASLKDRAGRLESDQDIEDGIALTLHDDVSWAEYLKIESNMLGRLAAGEKVEDVLNADPLPDLHEGSWPVIASELFEMDDETRGGDALLWFGDCLLQLSAGHTSPERRRPWKASFDRSIARSKAARDPEAMINDYIADEIWMFRWCEWEEPFDTARAEMATRVAVIRLAREKLEAMGVRPDQATAEAIMITDVATSSSEWPKAVDAIANEPSPARPIS